jgi:K+-sensing histidine kinase KdpD
MPKLSSILSYAVAVLSVALALAAGVLLDTYLQTAPYVSLFLCAILFVAWFGGIGPGLLAAALAIIAFEYYCLPPFYTFVLELKEMPSLILFATASVFVVC